RHFDRAGAQRHPVLLDEEHLVVGRQRDDQHRHAVTAMGAFARLPLAAPDQAQPLALVEEFGMFRRRVHAAMLTVWRHYCAGAKSSPAAAYMRRRVSGPNRRRSQRSPSAAASATPRSKRGLSTPSGASSAMVVRRRQSRA